MAHAKWILLVATGGTLVTHYICRVNAYQKSSLRIRLLIPRILCSNAGALVAQLTRASDWHSKAFREPSSGLISVLFFLANFFNLRLL